MNLFSKLKLVIKKNIQLVAVLTLLIVGILITILATYLYYWLRSPITLVAIWVVGLFVVYIQGLLVSWRKNKYTVDNAQYKQMAQKLMKQAHLSLHSLIIKKTKMPNAQVISFGNMRSIILTSSLCEIQSPKQLEAVIAHEVGHHVYNDVLNGTILGATVLDAIAYFSALLTRGLHGGIIMLTIICCVLAVVGLLLGTAYSRRREHRADIYAAELTGGA